MLRYIVTLCILFLTRHLFAQTLSSVETSLEAPTLQLSWEGPSECPTTEDVRRTVQREISRTPTGVPHRPIDVSVKVIRIAGERFVADVTFASLTTPTKREIQANSCLLLADATAVLVALVATRDVYPPSADVTPPQALPVVTAPPKPNQNSLAPTKSRTPHSLETAKPLDIPHKTTRFLSYFGATQGQFIFGRTPTTQVGVALSVGAQWRSLRVSATTEGSVKRSIELGSVSEAEAVFRSWGGGLRACDSFAWGNVAAGPCLGGQLVKIEGTGRGRVVSSTDSSAELEGWGGIEGRWSVGRIDTIGNVEVGLPAFRHRFVIRSADERTNIWSFDTRPVRVRLLLGLALRF